MKPSSFFSSDLQGQRGSAFITVIMFIAVLFIAAGSVLSWSLTERRLNMRNSYWLEARNSAEGVAEYGFAQVVNQFSTYASPPTFDPGGATPLNLPPSAFFSGGKVITSAYSATNTTGMEVIGGSYAVMPTSGGLYYVDPNNPDNQFDTLKGQYVYRRDVQVLARATVVPPTGGPITAYVTEKVSIRGAPLFSHAIFYSANDLEIAPGPVMNIYGPVHVNGNIFLSSQGSSLNFYGPVSASGNLYHAWENVNTAAQGAGNENLGTTPVTFTNGAGSQVSLKNASTGVWKDSTMGADSSLMNSTGHYLSTATDAITQLSGKLDSSFRQYAAQTWNGTVQTSAMGVAAYYPISFDEVIDASGHKPDPHALIDAPDTTLVSTDPYYAAKQQVESQKMSMQSNLYVQVAVSPGAGGAPDTSTIKVYGPAGSAPTGTPAANIGPNGGILLPTVPSSLVSFAPFQASVPGSTSTPATQASYSTASTGSGASKRYALVTTTSTGGRVVATGNVTLNGIGATTSVAGGAYSGGSSSPSTGSYSYTTAAAALATAPGGGSTSVTPTGTSATSITSTTSGTVSSGLYDRRRQMGIDQVVVDMGQLRKAVQEMVASGSSGSAANAIKNADGSTWTGWNGAVYIDVQAPNNQTSAQSASVVLTNGAIASGQSLIPSYGANGNGLTIATNAPVYIKGNFNADGGNITSTSSATTPDDGKSGAVGNASAESPVCIAADAVTILSNSWSDATSYATSRPAASNTEVAAALLVGIQPTSNTANSGGAHNLPRFVENWGGAYATIRGSLVTMYSCKVATQPWSTAYYSPPNRNWGFDKIFQNGNYPPITPKVMSFRRVDFTDLSAAAYNAARHTLWPSRY